MRKRNEIFRYTPSKETTTIWVKQAALRLVDRLARDVPQPDRPNYLLHARHPIHLWYRFICSWITDTSLKGQQFALNNCKVHKKDSFCCLDGDSSKAEAVLFDMSDMEASMSEARDKRNGVLNMAEGMTWGKRRRATKINPICRCIDTDYEDVGHPECMSIGYVSMFAILMWPFFIAGCRASRASLSKSLRTAYGILGVASLDMGRQTLTSSRVIPPRSMKLQQR